jgi:PKD repeat protein
LKKIVRTLYTNEDHTLSTRRGSRRTGFLIALTLISTIAVSAIMSSHTLPASARTSSASLTSCGAPTVITVSQLESLTTAGIVPDKRSLTPPCSVTYNGKTYPTFVELDGISIIYSPYTGDCDAVITGYCDVHLEFACTISAGCLFEIDQTWFAAGYNYPVNTQGTGSVTQGTVVNATGFLYIDDHGIHELHPTVSVSVWGVPPPPSCGNGAIDPPSCTTCPIGYVMQNGTCVIPPSPLSTSFTFAPANPSVNSMVTFASMPAGGTPPYSVNWSFGDGTTGTGISTTHSYPSTGSFTVTETTTDSSFSSKTSSSSKSLTVSPLPPPGPNVNILSAPASTIVGQTVSFSGNANGGTTPYSYSWNFGDGGSASGASPTYAYTSSGIYTVTLTVTDSQGLTGIASSIIAVSTLSHLNIPPTLTVPGDQTIIVGQQLTFIVNATDPEPQDLVIVVARGLPSGATFDSHTDRFSWTPQGNQIGTIGVMIVAADNGSPPMSSSQPVTIHVEPAATNGGSGGGSSGGSGGPSGCVLCPAIGRLTTNIWLLVFGGAMLLIAPLVMMNLRARSRLSRTKRRLRDTGQLS